MILKMTHIWYVHVHLLALDAGAHIKTNPALAQKQVPRVLQTLPATDLRVTSTELRRGLGGRS